MSLCNILKRIRKLLAYFKKGYYFFFSKKELSKVILNLTNIKRPNDEKRSNFYGKNIIFPEFPC